MTRPPVKPSGGQTNTVGSASDKNGLPIVYVRLEAFRKREKAS